MIFLKRKSCGLGPRVVDHGQVARSTVDRRWREQEGARVQWRTHRSRASGHSIAQKLANGGGEWRAEHGDPVAGLTGARATVWRPGDVAVVEKKLSGGSAQASGELEKSGGGCGENRRGSPPFIGAGWRWGRRCPSDNGRLEGD
jgi:hypothetical protein